MDDRIRDALVAVRALAGKRLGDLAARRRADVAVWRQPAWRSEPHHPQPWASERGGCDPRRLAEGAHDEDHHWVGLDASGRPVLAELRRDEFEEPEPAEALEVWFHGEWWSDVRTQHGARRTLFDEGCAAAVVGLESGVYVLGHRSVACEARLTLPDGYAAAAELGLDPAEGQAYDAVASWLRYREAGWSWQRPDDCVLGAVTGVQGHTPEADTVLLLQIAADEALRFQFLDAGAIQFRIPTDALDAGDWTAVRALADSC